MPKESKFIKGSDALHATISLLPLLESRENYTKQTGKEQVKMANKSIIYVQNGTK